MSGQTSNLCKNGIGKQVKCFLSWSTLDQSDILRIMVLLVTYHGPYVSFEAYTPQRNTIVQKKCLFNLTRAPLGYFYNAPHWGGGAISSPPPLWSPKLLDRF